MRRHLALSRIALASAPALAAFFFFVAGILKFASMDAFARSVRTWDLLHPSLMDVAVLSVPPIELALAAAWLLRVKRRVAAFGMLALLLLFTSAYVVHLVFAQPPDCGCLGELTLFESRQHQAVFLIARNAVLAILLVPGLIRRR